jgi:creatine kinase
MGAAASVSGSEATMESVAASAKTVLADNPGNLCAKYLCKLFEEEGGWITTLDDAMKLRLLACVKTGIENPDSGCGCYALQPNDYDELAPFFKPLIGDYHLKDPTADKTHETSWDMSGVEGLPEGGVLDLAKLGLAEELSMRVRVGRNLSAFPLPGAMTVEHRIKFEQQALGSFAKLIEMEEYGGTVYSMTPNDKWKEVTGEEANPNLIDEAKYDELVKAHVMFKDMAADTYLASAGIASDWPMGRGCWQSADKQCIIWFGEEDHFRIMCMKKGYILNEVFDRLKTMLDTVSGLPGMDFATSPAYGMVTSCPTNLGTGMRASVQVKVPNLTQDGTDTKAKEVCKPLGLSVRGTGGEHTPIGADGTIDLSPSARLFIKESEILTALYKGLELLLKEEAAAV